MTIAETVMTATPPVPRVDRASLLADRRFYVIAAYAMLILTAVGFREFLLRGRGFGGGPMTSPIVPLIVVHGLAMFAWVVLFCVQSTSIVRGKRRLHMVLGPLGGVLAAAIVILGSSVALLSVHFNADLYAPFGGARFFLAIMLSEMVLFGTFVAIGIANRHRAEIHRPMMLLATIAIISGSLGRIPYVVNLAILPPLYVYWPALLLGGVLFLLQWGMTRLANRWYLIGYAGIAVGSVVSVAVGSTTLWSRMIAGFVP